MSKYFEGTQSVENLPGVGIYLLEFFLMDSDRLASLVKDEKSRARRPLIDAPNEYLVFWIHLGLLLTYDQLRNLIDDCRHEDRCAEARKVGVV
jgi:hypothetical protein